MPKLTDAGNLSLGKLTKSDRNAIYVQLVCGHVLVTAREGLAVAPAIKAVRVAVVRRTSPNAYGVESVDCLLAAVFTRDALQGIQWHSADAATIVQDASAELRFRQVGAAKELRALDLSNEPGLAALLQDVDLEDLGGAAGKDEFDVILEAAGSKKTQVIKEVRTLTNLGLKDAKDLVDGAPQLLLERVDMEAADSARAALERAGAIVTVR